MKYPKDKIFNYTNHRDFLSDTITLNDDSFRSFAIKFQKYFSHATLSRLLTKTVQGEYKWLFNYSNEKFFCFIKEVGLTNEEADFILFLKVKSDTISSTETKASLSRTINNLKSAHYITRKKNIEKFEPISFLVAKSLNYLKKKSRVTSIIKECVIQLEIQENRIYDDSLIKEIKRLKMELKKYYS